jgi:hypothetical protein
MSGVQDSFKEGLTTPLEMPSFMSSDPPVLSIKDKEKDGERTTWLTDLPKIQRRRRTRTQDSAIYSPTMSMSTSRSSNDSLSQGWPVKMSSPGQKRMPLTQVADPGNVGSNAGRTKLLVFDIPTPDERYVLPWIYHT